MGLVASYFERFKEYPVIFCIEKWKYIVAVSTLNDWGSLHPMSVMLLEVC